MNSDYSNQASDDKNCYLCFNGNFGEDCLYGVAFNRTKNCVDFYQIQDCGYSYEIFSVNKGYKNFFTVESDNCRESWFLLNCHDCDHCFGCVNLWHKQYHIFNVPYSKEEYAERIKKLNLGSYESLQKIRKEVLAFQTRYPLRFMHGGGLNTNVTGEYVYQSRNARDCYQGVAIENSRFVQSVSDGVKDSYDYTNWGQNSELIYESVSIGEDCQRIKFSFDCWPACQDVEYSMNCHSSFGLFGCVGLKKKNYCVLNKQYSKKAYEDLVEKIKAHMNSVPYKDKAGRTYRYGEFFPPEFSPLAYNDSSAIDYFPLSKESATKGGFAWRDAPPQKYVADVLARNLPDHIDDAGKEITKKIISCGACSKAYRIVPTEFDFYQQFGIPLPRLCHNCRFSERLKFKNPPRFWHRACQCTGQKSENGAYANTGVHFHKDTRCPNEFETPYAPDRPEIVYCEQCYNAEVV